MISFGEAAQAPVGFMWALSPVTILVATLFFYLLVDYAWALGLVFIVTLTMGFIPLVYKRRHLRYERKLLLARMEKQFSARFGSEISWQETIGGLLEGGGEGWAEESAREGDLVGVAVGIAARFLGRAVGDTPEIREKKEFAMKMQKINKAIEQIGSHFHAAIFVTLIGCSASLYAVMTLA